MALSESGGAAVLVPPEYANARRHTHAKAGGGTHTHSHPDNAPGHEHAEDDDANGAGVALLPLPGTPIRQLVSGGKDADDVEGKRDFSQAQRDEYAASGIAMPDGSYPIPDRGALRRAVQSYGRAPESERDKVKAHIVKRARALDATDLLPDDWREAKAFYVGVDFDRKAEAADGTLLLSGYANTFIAGDRGGDTTARRAFDRTLSEYLLNPVLLDEHKRDRVIGCITSAKTDDVGLRVEARVPKPPAGSEPWHVKAYHDIRNGLRRAFSMGGVFHRKGGARRGLIERVDLYEISVVSVPENQTSIFAVAESKGLHFDDDEGKAPVQQPGVGRGHGAHHHGGLGRRRGVRRRRVGALHVHRNGVAHRHAGGTRPHLHGVHSHGPSVRHAHGIAQSGHSHPGVPSMHLQALDQGFAAPGRMSVEDGWDYKAIADDANDGQPYDPAAEAEEIEERGDLGDLLAGLQEAIDEVTDRDDLSDQDKVDSIAGILEEFRSEAQAVLADSDDDEPDDDDVKAWTCALASRLGRTDISQALALPRAKEDTMGDESRQEREPATESKGLDAKAIDSMASRLAELEREKRERELEAEAERKAAERLEAEAKAAEEQAQREAEEQKALEDRVNAILEAKRGVTTTGRKHQWSPTGATGPQRGEAKHLGGWLRDLWLARRGDYTAYQRIEAGHAKAMSDFGYDEKALAEGTTGAGGFLVPPEYWQQGLAEYRLPNAPLHTIVSHLPVTSNLVYIPRATGTAQVGWVSENASKPSLDQTFGQVAVNIFVLGGISKVSKQLVMDSSPTVDGFVRMDLGRNIALSEDIAMLNGTGTGQPTGIANTTGIGSIAVSTNKLWVALSQAMTTVATTFYGSAKQAVLHPRDVAKLREAVDSNNRPLFEPGFIATRTIADPNYVNDPSAITPVGRIFGLDIYEDANIPTNLGGGSNETFALVGDFSQAYFLERQGVTMDVSGEAGTSFEQNQIWYRGEERVGFTAARQPTAFCKVTGLTPTAG